MGEYPVIYLHLPGVPPSANNAYANIRGTNKRTLTPEGRKYKQGVSSGLARQYPSEMRIFEKDCAYLIVVRFTFEAVFTKGWPTKAESKYRRIDVSNRLKLLEDALKEAGGIDDSQTMTLVLDKKQGDPEKTELWVWNLDKEETPFDRILKGLTPSGVQSNGALPAL